MSLINALLLLERHIVSKSFSLQLRLLQIAMLLQLTCSIISGQGFEWKGQISSWGMALKNESRFDGNSGIRYIPQFNYTYSDSDGVKFNTEVLLNIFYDTDFKSSEHDFTPYRIIFRYSTEQSETQFGLQKINFGSAQLLRPLMWFDRMDPRDPLKLTDGVYAIRFKYSFLDNSLLWLWCLIGNTEKVGYETLVTQENIPEFGGRIQSQILSGEMAATFHTRKVDASFYYYRENRYAFDGRWDFGFGVWIESVLQHNFSKLTTYKLNKMTTIGVDYTIPEGSGIYLMAEHLFTSFSNSFWESNQSKQISALMISHSLNLLDNVSFQMYYDWNNKNLYHYLQLQRTYDNFIINLAFFYYPRNGGSLFINGKGSLISGYGSQLMLIFNH